MAAPNDPPQPPDERHDTFVLLTSTPAHTKYLWRALQSHLRLGAHLGIGWDYYTFTYPKKLPENIRVFCSQNFLGDQNGDAWQIQTGLTYAIYKGYKYLMKSAGDIVIDRPENFSRLHDLLGADGDLLSRITEAVDTKFFFGKVEPLYRMATAARGVRRITWIEGQYMKEVRRQGLLMKPCDFWELLGLRHLQPGHCPDDWWQGLALEPGEWD